MALFSRKITTRGYEPDRFATVPIQRYLNYLEWLRWEFIQDPETGLLEGLQSGHFPVVRSQRFELIQRIGMGRDLLLWARVTKVGRSTVTLEHHVIAEDDGSLVAHAIVEGLWLGPSRRLVRIPDAFRELAEKHALAESPKCSILPANRPTETGPLIHTNPTPCIFKRKGLDLHLPNAPESTFTSERTIRPSDIDIFSHVNAATYVDMFEDALYEAYKVIGLSVAYGQSDWDPLIASFTTIVSLYSMKLSSLTVGRPKQKGSLSKCGAETMMQSCAARLSFPRIS